jgi:hypothetical protein
MPLRRPSWLLLVGFPLFAAGCGSSSDGPVGGPVPGALDDHCSGVPVVVVNPASCTATPPVGGDTAEPAVLYNAEGNDDDCKYHVSFSSTPVRLNQNVTFTVTVTALDPATPNAPVTGADPSIEGTLGDLHALPNTNPVTKTTAPGTYTIGPVKFDQSGQWVTRFHFSEDCADLPDSPHGHVAFYLNVP